jgi:hypothetical protein
MESSMAHTNKKAMGFAPMAFAFYSRELPGCKVLKQKKKQKPFLPMALSVIATM